MNFTFIYILPFFNLITALHFTIVLLLYEDLTAAHRRSCADDQPIKILHTSNFVSFPLSESGKLRFDWLTIKVICT